MQDIKSYLDSLAETAYELNDAKFCITGNMIPFKLPNISKITCMLENDMEKAGYKHNLLVYPATENFILFSSVLIVLNNIFQKKITRNFVLDKLQVGDLLSLDNAVVKYGGIVRDVNNKECVKIIGKRDGTLNIIKENMPFMQKVNTKKPLTDIGEFSVIRKKHIRESIYDVNADWQKYLSFNKTYFNKSVIIVAPIVKTKKFINDFIVNNTRLADLLLVGVASYDGKVKIINKGQFEGVPSIILASDLATADAVTTNNNKIQSIILYISDNINLENNLDYFDSLCSSGLPVVGILNYESYFQHSSLRERGFNVWVWNDKIIRNCVKLSDKTLFERKMRNSISSEIKYEIIDCNDTEQVLKTLLKYKNSITEYDPKVETAFMDLFSITFILLRSAEVFTVKKKTEMINTINKSLSAVTEEKKYLSADFYNAITNVCDQLKKIVAADFNAKAVYIENNIIIKELKNVLIVYPRKSDVSCAQNYWSKWAEHAGNYIKTEVIQANELFQTAMNSFQKIYICGWYNRTLMSKLLCEYKSRYIDVLCYPVEFKWKDNAVNSWDYLLHTNSFSPYLNSIGQIDIEKDDHSEQEKVQETKSEEDDIETVETEIEHFKFQHYIHNSSSYNATELVTATPVTFEGDCYAFYRSSHAITTVTDIIENNSENVVMKKVNELSVGDFIIDSDVNHDLLEDYANKLLEMSEYKEALKTAEIWKDSIRTERAFSTDEEIKQRIIDAGCKRNPLTIDNWLNFNTMVPISKEDLIYIAKATRDSVLMKKVDEVIQAGSVLRGIHQSAGTRLAANLRNKLTEMVDVNDDFDPLNMWGPVTINIEGFGQITLLKVIDISEKVVVSLRNTNRLLKG